MNRLVLTVIGGLVIAALASPARAATWYVDVNSTAVNPDGSYNQPWPTIADALASQTVLDNDVVWVAPGVYVENSLSFGGKEIHVRSESGPAVTVVDLSAPNAVNGFLFNSGEDSGAILEGFTICNAANGTAIVIGDGATPVIRGNIIRENTTYNADGAGIHIAGGGPVIEWCTIECNHAEPDPLAPANTYGGGIFIFAATAQSEKPIIRNCTIACNTAMFGGGIAINQVTSTGEDESTACGSPYPHVEISDCVFFDNYAFPIANVGGWGGAIGLFYGVHAWVVNCTVTDNNADVSGGGMYVRSSCAEACDSILWGNLEDGMLGGSADLHVTNTPLTFVDIAHSDLDNAGGPGYGNPVFYAEADVVTVDPDFVDPAACDYHLTATSTLINAGDKDCALGDYDIDGDDRIIIIVDIGADEYTDSTDCPSATIASSDPADGTIDARQPHPPGSLTPLQGIGSASEPMTITLSPAMTGADHLVCWALCEGAVWQGSPNGIASVTDLGSGQYQITLLRAITPGAATKIVYIPSGSEVIFYAHPGNVNGDGFANALDVTALVDYLSPPPTPPWGPYSVDIDHSGQGGPSDITREIDLLNGAQLYDPWLSTALPEAPDCDPACCGCDQWPAGAAAPEGANSEPEAQDNSAYITGMVGYLVAVDPNDAEDAHWWHETAEGMAHLAIVALSDAERDELACRLLDDELEFTSPVVRDWAHLAALEIQP